MPTIALVAGVRIIIYPKDHLPPRLHAILAEHEAMISIVTGDLQKWLAAHREEVAYVWQEIRALRYQGGMIEE